MIKGSLSSFSLGEVFQSLAVNNHSGTLKITEKTGEEKYLYFSNGEICLFSSRSHPALRIGEILVRRGTITREVLQSALEEQKTCEERLGKILTKSHGVSADDVQAALETKMCEEIYDLFLLREAEFEFFIDHFPEEIFDSFEKNLHISINTTSVLMEGLRLADEWKVIEKKIGTFNEIFVREPTAPAVEPSSPQEQAILEIVDGKTPVHKIFDRFPGSRFDCCKTLFEFLSAGTMRLLTLEECRAGGDEAARAGNLDRAIDFLEFAVQLAPDRPEPLVLVGRLLREVGRDQESDQALLQATGLFFERSQYKEAIRTGEPLVDRYPRHEDLLTAMFQSAIECNKTRLVVSCGDMLARLLIARDSKAHAVEILLKVCQRDPTDVDRHVLVGELLKNAGDQERAVTHLETSLESLGGNQYLSERLRILRLVYEIDPDRRDIKQEISNVLAVRDKLANRKKRRFTIVGAGCIVCIMLMVLPILYEVKARELYSHAMRLEQISLDTGDLEIARDAYGRVVESYAFSSRAGAARAALTRLRELERERQEEEARRREEIEKIQFEKVRELQESLRVLLAEARAYEEKNDFRKAFDVYRRARDEFPNAPATRDLVVPLQVTTKPPGCTLTIEGRVVGETPLIVRTQLGSALTLHVSRNGCEDAQKTITVGDSWTVHFDMRLRPLGEFRLSGPIHRALDASEGTIYFPSRDGFFYAFTPAAKELEWRRVIGRYGDLTSPASYDTEEIVLGNVNGEVAAFSRETGKSRWRQFVDTSVLARPVISPDRKWVCASDLDGKIYLIDHGSGDVQGTFTADDEIVYGAAFWSYLVAVPSRDNNLYLLSLPQARLIHTETFVRDIDCDLVARENMLYFTTDDGSLHAFDLATRRVRWSRSLDSAISSGPVLRDTLVLVGTAAGEIRSVAAETGESVWKLDISDAALGEFAFQDDRLYVGSLAGELVCVNLAGPRRDWLFRSDESISQAPIVMGRHLYVASTSGKFFVMEIFE